MGLSFLKVRKKTIDFSKNSTKNARCCRRNCNWPHLCHVVQRAWTVLMLVPGKRWRFWSWRLGQNVMPVDGTPWEWGIFLTAQKAGERRGILEFLGFRLFVVGEMLQVAIVDSRCHGKCGWEYDVTTSKDGVGEILSDVGGWFSGDINNWLFGSWNDVKQTTTSIGRSSGRIQETKHPLIPRVGHFQLTLALSFCNQGSTSYTWSDLGWAKECGWWDYRHLSEFDGVMGTRIQSLTEVGHGKATRFLEAKTYQDDLGELEANGYIFWVGSELWRQEGEGLWMFEWEVALFERYFSVGGKFGRRKSSEAVFTLQTKSIQKSKIVGKLLAAWKFQWLFESQKPSIQKGESSACPRTFLYHPWSWPCEKRWELMVGRISRTGPAGLEDGNLMFSRTLRVESTWTSLPWWWNDYWMV